MPRALVIDDSIFQRFTIAKVLKALGMEVAEAADGAKGVSEAARLAPDVIILDLNMPVMDGLEALELIRNGGYMKPVIIVTADLQDTTKARCVALGATAFLNKPLDEEALRAALRKYLGIKTE